MTRFRLLIPVSVLVFLLVGGIAPSNEASSAHASDQDGTVESSTAPVQPPPDSSAVAVIELFTSEGCSSCPPADRLLRSLVTTAREEDRPVYALSFHVDYWNQLGWKDPYSDAAYSQRQRRYAQKLGVDTYTPQIVVNGQRAMVGSRAGQVRREIESVLAEPSHIGIDLHVETGDELTVTYRLDGALPAKASLRLALVERGLTQNVSRGENAGRTLRHANVVRSFTTLPARRQGTAQLSVPNAVDHSQASVIAYVQAPTWAVLGAARADLRRKPSAAR